MDIVEKISNRVGGQSKLARTLGVSKMAVSSWKGRGVPPRWVLRIEKLTGIPCWEIRPDLYPKKRFGKKSA